MKAGFYPKLAAGAVSRNKRMYLPYILTCIGMVMMYYIIVFLQNAEAISYLRGAATIRYILQLGGGVIAVFACIFLFYTNSFLIRRRKKEFGLYNVLGMGKKNISKILFWETLITAGLSIGIGLFCGIAFSKLAEAGLVRIMRGDVTYTLSISFAGIAATVSLFGVIFILLFINSVRQIRFSSISALIRGENTGEKPPKGNLVLGIIGLVLLGSAYYMAVSIKDPISALGIFFIAVIMVIVGTYLTMIAGSVLFCRILQRKKNYYYKPNHFVSVSSMVYRMKRNGAGLASICILATMVLVMISSTASLYFGADDSISRRYPREINLDFRLEDVSDLSDTNIAALTNEISGVLSSHDVTPENVYSCRSVLIAGLIDGSTVETDVSKLRSFNITTLSDVCQFYFVPLADYNASMGTSETLESGEALIYTLRTDYKNDTISFNNGNTFKIKKHVSNFMGSADAAMSITPSAVIIVPDLKESIRGIDKLADFNGDRMITVKWTYDFDTDADAAAQSALCDELKKDVFSGSSVYEKYGLTSLNCEGREIHRDSFYSMYGGIFYLGIILSIVFILAAVLIIYYKQISEGYEDQARFEIMQKVGMTKREIRKSINSQLLTVFFLPLIFAATHLIFAFPIIRKLLLLFNLNNVMLFAFTTIISVFVFALFYALVYRITSNAYYNIVSGAKQTA